LLVDLVSVDRCLLFISRANNRTVRTTPMSDGGPCVWFWRTWSGLSVSGPIGLCRTTSTTAARVRCITALSSNPEWSVAPGQFARGKCPSLGQRRLCGLIKKAVLTGQDRRYGIVLDEAQQGPSGASLLKTVAGLDGLQVITDCLVAGEIAWGQSLVAENCLRRVSSGAAWLGEMRRTLPGRW